MKYKMTSPPTIQTKVTALRWAPRESTQFYTLPLNNTDKKVLCANVATIILFTLLYLYLWTGLN